jgi:ferric-dicitrate binding protein FerR (iron transport regulator)
MTARKRQAVERCVLELRGLCACAPPPVLHAQSAPAPARSRARVVAFGALWALATAALVWVVACGVLPQ